MTTTPEQIEAVARAMWMADVEPYDPADRIPFEEAPETARAYCLAEALAAINTMRPFLRDEVLEEAAKVADGYHRTKEVTRDLMDDGHITTTTVRSLADPLKIAAAIRALKEKKNG
jgi:hypothetical protein